MTSPQEVGSRGIWNFNTVRRRLPQLPPSRWRFLRHIRFGSCPQRCRDGRGRAQGNIWEVPKRLDFFGRKTLQNMNSLLGFSMIFKVFSMMKFGTRITEPQTRNEEYPKHWSKALQIGLLGFTIPMIKTGCFICESNVVYCFCYSFSAWKRHIWPWAWKPMTLDGCVRLSSAPKTRWFKIDSHLQHDDPTTTYLHTFSISISIDNSYYINYFLHRITFSIQYTPYKIGYTLHNTLYNNISYIFVMHNVHRIIHIKCFTLYGLHLT